MGQTAAAAQAVCSTCEFQPERLDYTGAERADDGSWVGRRNVNDAINGRLDYNVTTTPGHIPLKMGSVSQIASLTPKGCAHASAQRDNGHPAFPLLRPRVPGPSRPAGGGALPSHAE